MLYVQPISSFIRSPSYFDRNIKYEATHYAILSACYFRSPKPQFLFRICSDTISSCRDEVTGEWRKLHNEELSDLYSLQNIVRVVKSRRMRWAWHVARMGEGRGVHRVLVGKSDGKRPLGRPRRRWEDNIKMDMWK